VIIFFLTRSACRSLQRSEAHPLRGWDGEVVARDADGTPRTVSLGQSSNGPSDEPEPPPGSAPAAEIRS
jgi:hypothetical protein